MVVFSIAAPTNGSAAITRGYQGASTMELRQTNMNSPSFPLSSPQSLLSFSSLKFLNHNKVKMVLYNY
jgi:hypothetical protein